MKEKVVNIHENLEIGMLVSFIPEGNNNYTDEPKIKNIARIVLTDGLSGLKRIVYFTDGTIGYHYDKIEPIKNDF